MLFHRLKLVLNMPHVGALAGAGWSIGLAVRGVVVGSVILLSACSVLDSEPLIKLDVPIATVSWQTEAEYCKQLVLANPVILEAISEQLPKACEWLPTFDPVTQALQPFCLASGQCERLKTIDSGALIIPAITKNARYTDIAAAQQRILELTRHYSALRVNTFGDIDSLVKRGLQIFEQIGLNPYAKALLAAVDSDLVSGVWQADNDLLAAVGTGHTYVSADKRSSLNLSASFDVITCESRNDTRAVLDVAPEQVKQLNFVSKIDHSSSEGSAYIVKHWLDLSGRLKRRTIPINIKAACSTATDSLFDEAYASAYFLVIKNTAASTPIWYLPPRG